MGRNEHFVAATRTVHFGMLRRNHFAVKPRLDYRQNSVGVFHGQEMAAFTHRFHLGVGNQFPEFADAGIVQPLASGVVGQKQQPISSQVLQVMLNR